MHFMLFCITVMFTAFCGLQAAKEYSTNQARVAYWNQKAMQNMNTTTFQISKK